MTEAVPMLAREIAEALAPHGFREVPFPAGLLLKRQTWNTNRAVVVLDVPALPSNLGAYLRDIRKQVAFACRFVPFFWGIGIQVVLIVRGGEDILGVDPETYVSKIDNQWAIIQSFFLVDAANAGYREGRTWGQVITGKYQDAIARVLERHLTPRYA